MKTSKLPQHLGTVDSVAVAGCIARTTITGTTAAALQRGRLQNVVIACATLAVFGWLTTATSKAAELTFGQTGKITAPIGRGNAQAENVALQRDGKIVVAGSFFTSKVSEFALARFNVDGSLDKTFGGSGKVWTAMGKGCGANAIAIESDGKIVLAGYASDDANNENFALSRYNPDGTLDNNFNSTGKVSTAVATGNNLANAVVIQGDGKIVAAGKAAQADSHSGFAVLRYNSDGSLDTTFGGTGKVITEIGNGDYANSLALQSDGKIVVVGDSYNPEHKYDIAVVRYNVDGSLDKTFNTTGKVTTAISGENSANGVAIQKDGKIVVAGSCSTTGISQIAVVRYNPDGTLDANFNRTGKVTTAIGKESRASSVALQTDDKIVVAGLSTEGQKTRFALARYNADGTLDPVFNGTGEVITAIADKPRSGYGGSSLALQADNKIVVVGYCFTGSENFALARYDQNGKLDTNGGRTGAK
jgi:uncharacterized delta-60 repeat protein